MEFTAINSKSFDGSHHRSHWRCHQNDQLKLWPCYEKSMPRFCMRNWDPVSFISQRHIWMFISTRLLHVLPGRLLLHLAILTKHKDDLQKASGNSTDEWHVIKDAWNRYTWRVATCNTILRWNISVCPPLQWSLFVYTNVGVTEVLLGIILLKMTRMREHQGIVTITNVIISKSSSESFGLYYVIFHFITSNFMQIPQLEENV